VIERAMILGTNDGILPMHLPREIVGAGATTYELMRVDPWEQWLGNRPNTPIMLEELIERIERYFVRWALETAKFNRAHAAELLGFTKVDQLRYLMKKHVIEQC
jgi:DNA-binding NtrC family response regulator